MFIRSITVGEHGAVCVTLADESTGGQERMVISSKLWESMNSRFSSLSPLSPVDEEIYDALKCGAERTSALREASRMIGSGEKSKREIARRLRRRGISEDAADWAAAVLEKNGYLDENGSCERIAESAVHTKHYGRRRVLDYLLSHGFGRDAATRAADGIDDDDYRAALMYIISHKYPHAADCDYKERQKITASLMRLGFSAGEIGGAIREYREQEEENT